MTTPISALVESEDPFRPSGPADGLKMSRGERLSRREADVLGLLAEGFDTDEVAERLSYSPRTVKTVEADVRRRFNLRNRTHAVAYAIRLGLI